MYRNTGSALAGPQPVARLRYRGRLPAAAAATFALAANDPYWLPVIGAERLAWTFAVYTVTHRGPIGVTKVTVNQDVASSQWVTLGNFAFQDSYRIELTDETGEPDRTRSVAADAVRLTPTP
jgi:hypothetical protein